MYRKSQYILLSQEHLYHDTLPFSISYTTSATFIVEVLCDTSTTVRLALSSFRDFRMMPSFRESRLRLARPEEGYQRGSFHYGVLMPDKVFKTPVGIRGFPFSSSAFTQPVSGSTYQRTVFPPVLCRTVQNSCPLFYMKADLFFIILNSPASLLDRLFPCSRFS